MFEIAGIDAFALAVPIKMPMRMFPARDNCVVRVAREGKIAPTRLG